MEFQLPKCLYCPICYELYDDKARSPIIIPCGNGHTICATCIVNTWGEDGKFCCPFDKVELYYYNGIVNELAKNRVVLDALEELKRDYCSQHSSRKLDLVCNTCQTQICSACQLRGSHEGHEVILVEEFDEEVEKSAKAVRKYLGEVEEIFEKIIKIVNQRQTILHEMINDKFRLYAEKLKNAREFMKKQIEHHFKKMKEEIHSNVLNQGTETKQILSWKTKAKEITTKGTAKKSFEDGLNVIKQKKAASNLAIEKWLEEKKQNILKLEGKLDKMWLEFEKEFENSLYTGGNNDFQVTCETFMDNLNTEIVPKNKPSIRHANRPTSLAYLEPDDNGAEVLPDEPEEPGSSTVPKNRNVPRTCKNERKPSVEIENRYSSKQHVRNQDRFLRENRKSSQNITYSRLHMK